MKNLKSLLLFLSALLIIYCSDPTSSDELPDDLIYVCNQGEGTVSIIDAQKHNVLETLSLADYGYSTTSKPHHIVVSEDGSTWFVSLISDGKVLKFNKQNELLCSADVTYAGILALHPSEEKLYAGRTMSVVNVPSSIVSINVSTMTVNEIPLAFARPHALWAHSGGEYVFSGSLSENKIAIINTSNDEVENYAIFPGNSVYVQFAESVNGNKLFVTGQTDSALHVLNVSNDVVTYDSPLAVGRAPWHPALSNDGDKLYFGNKLSNSISIIDLQTYHHLEISGNGLSNPHGSALSDDGRYLFISNQNTSGDYKPVAAVSAPSDIGTVVVMDTQSSSIIKVIEIGKTPSGMGS